MVTRRLATIAVETQGSLLDAGECEEVGRLGLLLVDDSRSWAELRHALQAEGYHVWAVAHGPGVTTLYRLCKTLLRAVVIDLDSEDPRGLETLRSLVAIDPDVECIVMSSEADGPTQIDGGNAVRLLTRAGRARDAARDIKQALTHEGAG